MMIQDDALNRYMKDIKLYPLLGDEKEKELLDIFHNSQNEKEIKKAKDALILGNLGIVVKCAIKVYRDLGYFQDSNMSVMDLIQVGNEALEHSIGLYDATKGAKLSNYAYTAAERRMKKAIKESRFIRLPPGYFSLIFKVNELQRANGGYLTDQEISEKLKINIRVVPFLRRNREAKISLDFLREEDVPIEALMEKEERKDPTEVVNHTQELKNYLYEKIKEFKPRDRDIMHDFFFSNKEHTLKSLGIKYNITRERVRQIVEKSVMKLRKKVTEDGFFRTENIEEKEIKNEDKDTNDESSTSQILDWVFEEEQKKLESL